MGIHFSRNNKVCSLYFFSKSLKGRIQNTTFFRADSEWNIEKWDQVIVSMWCATRHEELGMYECKGHMSNETWTVKRRLKKSQFIPLLYSFVACFYGITKTKEASYRKVSEGISRHRIEIIISFFFLGSNLFFIMRTQHKEEFIRVK